MSLSRLASDFCPRRPTSDLDTKVKTLPDCSRPGPATLDPKPPSTQPPGSVERGSSHGARGAHSLMPSVPKPAMQVLQLARQPILDRSEALDGFELLFRSAAGANPAVADARAATSQVILNAFMELGVEKVLGRHRGFINV